MTSRLAMREVAATGDRISAASLSVSSMVILGSPNPRTQASGANANPAFQLLGIRPSRSLTAGRASKAMKAAHNPAHKA